MSDNIENSGNNPIMLIEDNLDHQELILEALEDAGIKDDIVLKSDGEKAWNFLNKFITDSKDNDDEHVPNMPKIILLDINLPKISGLELLKMIKGNEILKIIPVIMLTTSRNERDVFLAYEAHANSYITKPMGFKDFANLIKTLINYWCRTNTGLV
ncbi:MAG: response regulator [archaeon]|nr:response regulator [archaeon]